MSLERLDDALEDRFSPIEKKLRQFYFSAITNDERKKLNDKVGGK